MQERCLLVSSFMAEYKGGYIPCILALIKKMHENGDELTCIFPTPKKEIEWIEEIKNEGCKVYFLDYDPYSLSNINFIKKIIKKEKINLIHSDFTGWDITVKLAAPFIPTIWHERMRVNDIDFVKKMENLVKYRVVGAVKTYPVGISDDVYRAVSRLSFGNKSEKIMDVLDVNRFDTELERPNNEIKKFLMFSYSPIVKGVDIAFDAMEELNRDELIAKLVLVSHGACDDYVAKRYPELPEWLELEKPREDVQYFYKNTDYFISASRSEGFSLALIESIYNGMSVIASDIPGTAWSREFKSVDFFSSGEKYSLLNEINKKLKKEISDKDIQFNRQKVIDEFSIDGWVNKVTTLHKKILKK